MGAFYRNQVPHNNKKRVMASKFKDNVSYSPFQ